MAYKIVEKKVSEVRIEVNVDRDKLKKVTDLVTEDLGKSLKIAGFRPGKAPRFLVEKEVGKDKFWAEVMDKIIPEAYYEAVVKEKFVTLAQPQVSVKSFVPDESLVFEATIAVLPEIKNLKYKNLKIRKQTVKVTSEEINKAIEELAKRMTKEIAVNRPAKKGDKVEIDFEGKLKGLPFDGGTSKNHPLILGSSTFVPGFEEKIIGHKAGEEFEIKIKFPTDYHAKNLAGQDVNFKIKINSVLELQKPKIDDDLAKSYNFKDTGDMKINVKKELEFQAEIEAKRKTEEKILEKIIELNKIEAPRVLVSEQIHQMVHEAEHNLSHSGLTLEKFLEMSKKTLQEIEKEMEPEAEKRVKIGIVFGEVAKLEKIESKDKEVDAEIEKIISVSGESGQKEDIRAAYNTPERRREIANNIIIKKVLEKLWEYNVS